MFFCYFNVLFFIQPVFYSVVIMLKFPRILKLKKIACLVFVEFVT